MRYMLDTNICNYAIKNRPESALTALRKHEAQGIGISSISVAELHFGVQKAAQRKYAGLASLLAGAG